MNDHSWRAYCLYLFGLIATEDKCALDLFDRSLSIRKQVLQPSDSSIFSSTWLCHRKAFSIRFGTTYNNMGEVYHDLGEYDNALKYYEMDLEVYTKSLPSQHIDTFRPFKCIVLLAI